MFILSHAAIILKSGAKFLALYYGLDHAKMTVELQEAFSSFSP